MPTEQILSEEQRICSVKPCGVVNERPSQAMHGDNSPTLTPDGNDLAKIS